MDAISIITAAAAAFGNSAVEELAKRSIGEAWDGVKKAIHQRFGSSSEVPVLMDELRAAPAGSQGSTQVVARLAAANLDGDSEVAEPLRRLASVLGREGVKITPVTVNAQKIFGAGVNYGTMHMTFNGEE
jgi:hypothetical protein